MLSMPSALPRAEPSARRFSVPASLLLVTLLCGPLAAQTFDLIVIDSTTGCATGTEVTLQTEASLNNAGQVMAQVSGVSFLDPSSAFVREADGSSVAIDVLGDCRSTALVINEAGQVAGLVGGGFIDPVEAVFRFSNAAGVETLDLGLTPDVLATLEVADLNDGGEVLANATDFSAFTSVPYVYRDATGWEDLSGLDPAFVGQFTVARAINNAGDIVIAVAAPGGIQLLYFAEAGGGVTELTLGTSTVVFGDLNESGQVTGVYRPVGGPPDHAFIFNPGGALEDIHTSTTFPGSAGFHLSPDGRVLGILDDGTEIRNAFLWEEGVGMTELLDPVALDALFTDPFESLYIEAANDALDFAFSANDGTEELYAIYRQATGEIIELQSLVDSLATENFEVQEVGGLNNDGDILIGAVALDRPGQPQVLLLLDTAGAGGPVFRRGDPNGDGGSDISDAVFVLAALFTPGAPSPSCADAGDTNDDGSADISDAVFLLASLFTPGAPPPSAPGPDACGVDPTDDPLDCASSMACP